MTVDLGFMDTPIYDAMKAEEKFIQRVNDNLEWAELEPANSPYTRGWDFAISMLADALENGDYAGALAVPTEVVSQVEDFCEGYADAMLTVRL